MRQVFLDLWRRPILTPRAFATDAALLVGRLLMVLALFPNGLRKIMTFAQTAAGMGGTEQIIGGRPFPDQTPLFYFPAPEIFLGASVVFDLLGTVLIVLGLRTRAVSATSRSSKPCTAPRAPRSSTSCGRCRGSAVHSA